VDFDINIRYHVVQEFNKGVYDYIIATDESGTAEHDNDTGGEEEELNCERLSIWRIHFLTNSHSCPNRPPFTRSGV